MRSFRSIGISLLCLSLASFPTQASVFYETCAPQELTPDQRINEADLVFEGKVTSAKFECHALANGTNSYGPQAACTDTIQVVRLLKGSTGPEFVQKNLVWLDPDPKAVLSHGECKDRAEDRSDSLVGKSSIYYIKQDANRLETLPQAVCE